MFVDAERTEDDGFSLIELLIVIIILGVLSAIVVFAISSTRGDAVDGVCKHDIHSIQLSAESMNNRNDTYPATSGVMGGDGLLTPNGGAVLGAWPGGASTAGDDDIDIIYQQTGGGSGYTLTVLGKHLTGSLAERTLNQGSDDDAVKSACAD